jgi:two-component system, response regulator PdtaR
VRILLVEDEPLILMDLELQLQDAGYEVISAHNADEAIDALVGGQFDVVLTDIDMPGSMDGLRLAAAVRHRWPPTQIVVMSGKRHPSVDELPTRARFLSKPLKTTELLKAVGAW